MVPKKCKKYAISLTITLLNKKIQIQRSAIYGLRIKNSLITNKFQSYFVYLKIITSLSVYVTLLKSFKLLFPYISRSRDK